MGVLSQMAALGVCTSGVILGVGPYVPAAYLSSDLFLAPFFAVLAVKVDDVLYQHNLHDNDTIFCATFGALTMIILRSTAERWYPETAFLLNDNGDLIQILVLQSYLFFGNCQSVQHYVSTMFDDQIELGPGAGGTVAGLPLLPIPKHLIIDFTLVTCMDTSAIDLISEVISMCQRHRCQLYVAGLSTAMKGTLTYAGVKPGPERRFLWSFDLESALSKAEDKLASRDFNTKEKAEIGVPWYTTQNKAKGKMERRLITNLSTIFIILIMGTARMHVTRLSCFCIAFVPPPRFGYKASSRYHHHASLPILCKDYVLYAKPCDTKKGKHQSISTPTTTQLPSPSVRTQLSFARDGHCVLRKIFSSQRIAKMRKSLTKHAKQQELLAWQQKVEVAAQSHEHAQACQTVVECQRTLADLGASPVDVPFLQYFNTWRTLPEVLEIAKDLAPIAAILLDCDSIRLYQDSVFWKRAGDGPTPWHTDGRMAPFDTSLLVTFWIPLQDDIPHDGSALVFCSKSHSDFALPYWNEYSKTCSDPASPWNRLEDRYGGEKALVDYMPLCMGDVTAHSGWVLHCADAVPINSRDRIALAISFVDASAPVRQSLKGTSKVAKGDAGDPEDAWSYRDWIHHVPVNQPHFQHDLVPILFPSKQIRRSFPKHRQQSKKGKQ
jgi:ectoine hydroxylase-related dioxygenase (phytanoyl-CoA dioxygenase family)